MDTLRQDLRYALRALGRAPGFTLIAILSLTLGIGVNSTLFSLVSAVHLRPLPYRDARRLVDLHELNPRDLCSGCAMGTSYATYLDWRAGTTSYERMGAYLEDVFALSGGETPLRVQGGKVSAELFPLLGVQPVLGRTISTEEDRVGGGAVVLLGHALWERAFGADSSVIGRQVRLNGAATTVIGVMPPRFKFPEFAELWTPIAPDQSGRPRDDRQIGVVARLKPGVTVTHANAELARLAAGVAAAHPETFRNWTAGVVALRDDLTSDSGAPFLLLLAASGFVLLIACANLANLLLARALRRERDFAVRAALGASRARVARHLLTESLLLAVGGGALGLLLALWGVDAVTALIPGQIPFWIQPQVDWRVVAFTVLASLATGFAFGVLPAFRISRLDLHDTLKEGQRSSTSRGRGRLRGTLVIAEVALALVLLAGAGLSAKTYLQSRRSDDLGFEPRGVLFARIELVERRFDDPQQVEGFARELLARLQGAAGAEASALEATRFLGTFVGNASRVTIEGATAPIPDRVVPRFARAVTPGYFALLHIPLRRGRAFSDADGPGAAGVAVVNEAAAAVLWPGVDALGKRVRLGGDDAPWLTIVGIVGDIAGAGAGRRAPAPFIYTSLAQAPTRPLSILVRTRGTPSAFAASLRGAVDAVDPEQPLTDVEPYDSFTAGWVTPVLFFARILGALSLLAVTLAAVGIYGVVSYVVSQRTHEIGVRVALGAPTNRILRLVVGHGLLLGSVGAAIGLAGSLGLTSILRQMLFGASPVDPVVLGSVTLVLLGVAVVASAAPARRALAVNPVEALKAE